jgi:hypothetical protein
MCSFSVYLIYRTKLGVIGCFVLSFFFLMYETTVLFLIYVYEGQYRKNKKNFSIEPISANPRIVLCSVVYRRCIARTLVYLIDIPTNSQGISK